jgi:hypothetical protein
VKDREGWMENYAIPALLIICISLAFSVVAFSFNDGDMDRDFMPISLTYDNFYHPLIAKGIYDSGDSRVYPIFRAVGVKNAAIADPPLHFIVPATFVKLTNLPFYQGHFFISVFFIIWTSILMFVLVYKYFKKSAALMTLALSIIPLSAIWLFPLYIGFTPTFEAFFFIPLMVYLFLYTMENSSWYSAALLGIAWGAQFLTHGPFEAGLMGIFLTIIVIVYSIVDKTFSHAIKYSLSLAITGILSIYQYYLLRMTRITSGNITETLLAGNPVPDYFPRVSLSVVMWILVVIGIVFIALLIIQKKMTRYQGIVLTMIAFFLAFSMSNIVGIDGSRTYRTLYTGYPFFMLIPALGIFGVWQYARKYISNRIVPWIEIIAVIVILSFSATVVSAQLKSIGANGMAKGSSLESLHWIRDNTAPDARVFFLFGFIHEYGMLSERTPLKGDVNLGVTQENIISLCNGKYPEYFIGQWGAGLTAQVNPDDTMSIPVTDKPFSIEYEVLMQPGTDIPVHNVDNVSIENIDYVVLQYRGTQVDPCMAFFLNQSLERGDSIAWYNDQYAIVKVK